VKPIGNAGQGNRVLQALYGNAAQDNDIVVTDDGDVYVLPDAAARAKVEARGLTVRAEKPKADKAKKGK
jgi:hypothetical protein